MKLPIFHTSKKFETLFKEMGTEYSKINMNLWDTIEDSVLDEILKKGEVLIENEEIGTIRWIYPDDVQLDFDENVKLRDEILHNEDQANEMMKLVF